jgi:large subunit ribosomal protein L6
VAKSFAGYGEEMSRIGRMPIVIPDKVKMDIRPNAVEVTGPLGKMVQSLPPHISVKIENNQALVQLEKSEEVTGSSLHGLARSLINNAVVGVTQGFKKNLEIVGLGYRAQAAGDKLTLQLGFAHPIEFKLPPGIKAVVDAKMTQISISGIDRYQVGETSAQIRRLRPPEPYKGTGIRYAGEHIIKKAGKAAAGAAGAVGGAKK